ncbi:MAG: N-6 DNA methylase, partial [Candidatus Lokiarchaeota archaeon]
ESSLDITNRIKNLFNKVKEEYSSIFAEDDKIEIDGKGLKYIIGELQDYTLIEADRDAIRKAFEVFIGPALRGSEGQFFTPRNVVQACVSIIDPDPGDKIIDPACGSGGFLVITLTYIWEKLKKEKETKNWSEEIFFREWNKTVSKCFKGIDRDRFLTKVTRAYMAIIGNGKENIFCENSLESPTNWKSDTQVSIKLYSFDGLLTNPPFGSKIKIKDKKILSQYDLAHKWHNRDGTIEKSSKLKKNRPPQILFIERALQFLKKGGRMAIVLPEGILGNPTQEYIRKFIVNNSKVIAVIDAPTETFLPNTSTKTCILFLKKEKPSNLDYNIFMAIADTCGHDSRDNVVYKMNNKGEILYNEKGDKVIDDDFPIISTKYKQIKDKSSSEYDRNGFFIPLSKLRSRSLIPRFYDPSIKKDLSVLKSDFNLIRVEKLIDEGLISIFSGQGVQKKYYGTGDIPYIRTSDISNWEPKIDPTHSVSDEIFEKFKQDLKINDILFVQDGGRLIGKTCILSEKRDIKTLIQSHFQIIRIKNQKKLNPYLVLYLLNTPIVKKQISANIVVQSTIATIGDRIKDLILPIPKNSEVKDKIVSKIKGIIKERAMLRKKIEDISSESLQDLIN